MEKQTGGLIGAVLFRPQREEKKREKTNCLVQNRRLYDMLFANSIVQAGVIQSKALQSASCIHSP